VLEIAFVLCLVVLNGSPNWRSSQRGARGSRRWRRGETGTRARCRPRPLPIYRADRHHARRHRAGAFSGATFGVYLKDFLLAQGAPPAVAEPLGYGLVVLAITYLSLIIGELVPKNLALRNAEAIACAVAPMMTALARIGAPAVSLLDRSTKAVLALMGQAPQSQAVVTEEEINTLIAEAESAGVLETGERQMIAGVMRLGDRAVSGLMTPRTDVDWIDILADEALITGRLIDTTHSRLPVGEGSPDAMIGVVETRELSAALLAGKPLDIKRHVREAPIIPESIDALDILRILRDAPGPWHLFMTNTVTSRGW